MDLLSDYPLVVEIPVAWGEMDALSHVNNVVYFRYFETARIAYFQQIGLLDKMDLTKQGPVLRDTSCQYRRPVTFPDTISVGARVTQLKDCQFLMNYEIVSHRQNAVTTRGEANIVLFDFELQQKVEVPELIREGILAMQPELLK